MAEVADKAIDTHNGVNTKVHCGSMDSFCLDSGDYTRDDDHSIHNLPKAHNIRAVKRRDDREGDVDYAVVYNNVG
jgi:hypothetical protein